MSDSVVVMNGGVIQQIGTPQDIYNEPVDAFTASFIGESNIVPGIMHTDYRVEFEGRAYECVDAGFEKDEPVDVVVRPEDIEITAPSDEFLCGTVTAFIMRCLWSASGRRGASIRRIFRLSARKSDFASRRRTSISCTNRILRRRKCL